MGRVIDLPSRDRPRERLLAHGGTSLSDRELVALLLGTGGAVGVGAHVLAERLLAHFGSLDQLSRAHVAELMAVPGVGAAKATALAAAFELGLRARPVPSCHGRRGTSAPGSCTRRRAPGPP